MTSSHHVEVAVVGAGVVGLAVAAELAEAGHAVVVLERHPGPGRETSSRNSEVIHAGLYYPTGSLKARLCVEGRHLLYERCRQEGIAHRRIGKLVVACTAGELPALERLHELGSANGAEGLQLLDGAALGRMEPAVRGVAALHSPETGIVDSHGLIKSLEAHLRAAGGTVLYRCEVIAVDARGTPEEFKLRLRDPSGEEELSSTWLINAAGLEADRIAALAGVHGHRLFWSKGDYFSVSGPPSRAVSRLVYPVPRPSFLGVHVTLDLAGRMRLGPDATYVDRASQQEHLTVAATKVHTFAAEVQRYLPCMGTEHLQPDQAGIRPKRQGPGDSFKDFLIQHEVEAGVPHLVNLIGIESPGLTAALSIGKSVHRILLEDR